VVDRRPGLLVPVVPVALASLVAVVIGGTVLGFTHAHPHPPIPSEAGAPARSGEQPVLVVNGYGSTFDGTHVPVVPGPFAEQQFSYRGLAADGTPLPYGSRDTVKSLAELDRMIDAQVTMLARTSGRPVDIVAESEGALVAKTALLARPRLPVDALVLASPLLRPGQTSYPQPGAAGWGVAAGEFMTLLGHRWRPSTCRPTAPSWSRSTNRRRSSRRQCHVPFAVSASWRCFRWPTPR
jgi:alpha-beta hydrolase superfamily lysophospholipase